MSSVFTENSPLQNQKSDTPLFLTMLSSNLLLRSFVFSGIIYFSLVLGGWPGQAFITVLWLSLIAGLLSAIIFGKIARHAAAEQGLYFYLKHRLGQLSAFITTLLLFVVGNILLGFMISFLPKYILSQLVYVSGIRYENQLVLDFATWLQSPQAVSLFGIGLIVLAFILTSFSNPIFPKAFGFSIFLFLTVGIILLIQFGLPNNLELGSIWNIFYEEPVYGEVVNQARLMGMNNYIFGGVYAFAGMSIVLWLLTMGFENINLNAYYKKRTSVWVNLLSVIIPFLFLFAFYQLFTQNTSFSWMRAQAYLGVVNQGDFPVWLTTYAGLLFPNTAFTFIIGLFLLVTMVAILGSSLVSSGAFITAWAQDGILPPIFLLKNQANGKHSIPFLTVSILFGIGVLLSAFSNLIGDVVGFILVLQLAQLPIFFAVVLREKTGNKELGSNRNPFLVSIAAVVVGIIIIFSLVMMTITPVPPGLTPWLGITVAGISLILGLLYYYFLKNKISSNK